MKPINHHLSLVQNNQTESNNQSYTCSRLSFLRGLYNKFLSELTPTEKIVQPLQEELEEASITGEFKKMYLAILQGADPFLPDDNGIMPVQHAAMATPKKGNKTYLDFSTFEIKLREDKDEN